MNYEETLEYLSYLIGEDKYYVYCLSDPDTLKPLYIGKGRSYRILRHSTRSTDGQVTNNRLSGKRKSLKDQGKDFDFSILADSTNESAIYILETVYIRKYGLAMRGGTLLNFTYGGLLNEYNSYYGIDFYKEAKALRQDEGAKYFGHTVYLNGFIFPSYKQAVRSTKARKSVTALQKSINNGALKDACELNHNDLEKAKSFDHAISEMYAKYQREQEGLVAS